MDLLLERSQHRRLDDMVYGMVVSARNGVQHELLSLPRWQELSETDRGASFSAIYETCRLTALIYADAVLFPLPPSTGWLLKLLDELRQLLELSNLAQWRDDTSALLLWSLFVASIAAFKTVHRRFFREALRSTLHTAQIATWAATESVLEGFLWTDSACGRGAAVIWETLDVGT